MPVWAQIVLPAVAVVWAAWLVMNWLDSVTHRRRAAQSFMEWMNQERDDHHA